MELTKIEWRSVANQYPFPGLLEEDDPERYQILPDPLENGYEAAYHYEALGSMLDPLSPWGCKLVMEVMTIYSSIQRSFESADDKTEIEEWRTWFPGFDGDLSLRTLCPL